MDEKKRLVWRFVIQTAISILTALTSSLKKHVFYN